MRLCLLVQPGTASLLKLSLLPIWPASASPRIRTIVAPPRDRPPPPHVARHCRLLARGPSGARCTLCKPSMLPTGGASSWHGEGWRQVVVCGAMGRGGMDRVGEGSGSEVLRLWCAPYQINSIGTL